MTACIVVDFEVIDVDDNGREASSGINARARVCELQLVSVDWQDQ